jgi:hypothetical protein
MLINVSNVGYLWKQNGHIGFIKKKQLVTCYKKIKM